MLQPLPNLVSAVPRVTQALGSLDLPKGQRKSLLLVRVLCCCTQVVAGDALTGAGNRQAQNLVHSSKVGFFSPCPIDI